MYEFLFLRRTARFSNGHFFVREDAIGIGPFSGFGVCVEARDADVHRGSASWASKKGFIGSNHFSAFPRAGDGVKRISYVVFSPADLAPCSPLCPNVSFHLVASPG